MAQGSRSRLRDLVTRTVGPAPWYWNTFPRVRSKSGQKFVWTYHGEHGALAYLVSLALEEEPDRPRLALNTYCRPFLVPDDKLGIWCPQGRSIRIACFEPDDLKPFEFGEIVGWFKQSGERVYAASAPMAELEAPLSLGAGTHRIDVPQELRAVDELMAPTSYPARGPNDPAFALYACYLQAGLVEVLPQRWFTASQYDVGRHWITRAGRDAESHRIVGECLGVGSFALEEDGMRLERWLDKDP